MSTLSKSCLRLAALVLCAASLSSCNYFLPYQLSGNPAHIPQGATPLGVRAVMRRSPTYQNKHQHGETWVYSDYWHNSTLWAPSWGTWEIYMEESPGGNLRFRGWKMIEPPYQEPAVRSEIVTRAKRPATKTTYQYTTSRPPAYTNTTTRKTTGK
jgi:hypothetical protein